VQRAARNVRVESTRSELAARRSEEDNPETRTIVLVARLESLGGTLNRRSLPGTAQTEPEQFIGFVAASTAAARKCSQKPEHISPSSRGQHAKRAEPKGPTPKTRTKPDASSPKARLPNPKVLASTPARGFMAVYRSLRYLLLYLPLHLTLVLRSSSYALPYAETLQVFQALAPDPFVLRPRA